MYSSIRSFPIPRSVGIRIIYISVFVWSQNFCSFLTPIYDFSIFNLLQELSVFIYCCSELTLSPNNFGVILMNGANHMSGCLRNCPAPIWCAHSLIDINIIVRWTSIRLTQSWNIGTHQSVYDEVGGSFGASCGSLIISDSVFVNCKIIIEDTLKSSELWIV